MGCWCRGSITMRWGATMSEKRIRVVRRITYEGPEGNVNKQLYGWFDPNGEQVCHGSLKAGTYDWLTKITVEDVSREEIPSDEKGGNE